MDQTGYMLTLAFAILSFFLFKSKHQRSGGIFFMVRSQLGVRLLDKLAKRAPKFWNFLADFSVLLSFGGIGGYYLLSHKKSAGNFNRSFVLLGLMFAIVGFAFAKPFVGPLVLALTVGGHLFHKKNKNPFAGFFTSALLFSITSSQILASLSGFRMEVFISSVALGAFGLPAIMVYALLSHGMSILTAETDLPGVSPMVPSSRDGNVGIVFPGYDIFIPWWHALLALFVTLVVHEGAHGILVRCSKVKLKSTGLLTALALPIGAFVEPDEEQLEKKSSVERMRVFTMGSFANIVTGVSASIALALFMILTSSLLIPHGLLVTGFIKDMPAEQVMEANTVIYHLNGARTGNYTDYVDVADSLKPGETAVLNTSEGIFEIVLAKNEDDPEKGYVGVYLVDNMVIKPEYESWLTINLLGFVYQAFKWIIFFNINIALVNLLPVIPFDGGRMFKEFVETLKISENGVNRILYSVIGFTLILFLVNMIPLFSMILESIQGILFDM